MPPTTKSKKSKSSSPAPAATAPAHEPTLEDYALRLLHLTSHGNIQQIKKIFELGAPAWYQEESTGWSCLHFAAHRGDWEIVKLCLDNGAVWNSADLLGRTAGDIALSLNDEKSYILIRNEGIRQEMIHHAIASTKTSNQDQPKPSTSAQVSSGSVNEDDHIDVKIDQDANTATLKNIDPTSAGDNFAFLKSKLTWTKGDDGKERVLDEDGNGVMMGWEEPLMIAHTKYAREKLQDKIARGEEISVLNIGFGLGIIDSLLQKHLKPARHVIIEAHPSVLEHLKTTPFHDSIPGVEILDGRWQDWCKGDKLGELIGKSAGSAGFDFVFIDTFAEGYEELKEFFEIATDLLEGPESVFSFWNGLGATNPLIYDVACELAEMHMDDVGLKTEWHTVLVDDATAEETWKGVKRLYWNLPVYRLPVATYSM